jgi:hypothetical protein
VSLHFNFEPAQQLHKQLGLIFANPGTKKFARHQSGKFFRSKFPRLEYSNFSIIQTHTNASTPAGESPRVLTTVSEDDSRAKWLCHRYVGSAVGIGAASDGITKSGLRSHHDY